MVGVAIRMWQTLAANDLGRAAGEQRTDDRVRVGVIVAHDFGQWALQQVADRDALANVQVTERVYVPESGRERSSLMESAMAVTRVALATHGGSQSR